MDGELSMGRARPTGDFGAVVTPIIEDLDVFEVRRTARAIATAVGFDHRAVAELVLAVSELATNIIKFACPGEIRIEPTQDDEHDAGIRITARDSGPPFSDFAAVLARSSVVGAPMEEWTGRGLGGGLGAVYRFTDVLRSEPVAGGKQIVAERFLVRPRRRGESGTGEAS